MKIKIGIIGGGREGQWWKRFFEAKGFECCVSDTAKDNAAIIACSNVIVLAVPMSAAESVASRIANVKLTGKLLISVCGLMSAVEREISSFQGDIVFFHRMIGPQVSTMKRHNMIVNLVRLSSWKKFVDETIIATEATVISAVSSEHDEMVGLTQAIVRIMMLAFGLVSMEAPLPVQAFSNVPFSGLVAVLARILDFGHLLSRDMVFENPFARAWIDKLHNAMLRIESEDEDFEKLFMRLSDFLGTGSVKAGSHALAAMPQWWE